MTGERPVAQEKVKLDLFGRRAFDAPYGGTMFEPILIQQNLPKALVSSETFQLDFKRTVEKKKKFEMGKDVAAFANLPPAPRPRSDTTHGYSHGSRKTRTGSG